MVIHWNLEIGKSSAQHFASKKYLLSLSFSMHAFAFGARYGMHFSLFVLVLLLVGASLLGRVACSLPTAVLGLIAHSQ